MIQLQKKRLADTCQLLMLAWHDCVVVRASASQSVDLGFIQLVESYRKSLKMVSIAFLLGARHLRGIVENKLACFVLGQGTFRDAPNFMWKTGGPDTLKMATPKRVQTS